MIESITYRMETTADTREKAVRALGFDEPPVMEKLSRSDFSSDEEYFHACAELAVRNHSPEYRAEYSRIRKEYTAKKAEEEAAAAEQKRQEELAKEIRDCVLRPEEQARVDDAARRCAQDDLASGKISFQEFGAAVEDYARKLSEEAKKDKVFNADINKQIRAAMSQIIHRR